MSNKTREQKITETPLFRNVSGKGVHSLSGQVDQAVAEPGYVLVAQGTLGREVYFINSGKADVIRYAKHVATIGEGDLFGELAVMTNQPRSATVVAKTELDVLVMGRREFNGAVEDMPVVARELLSTMATRLR